MDNDVVLKEQKGLIYYQEDKADEQNEDTQQETVELDCSSHSLWKMAAADNRVVADIAVVENVVYSCEALVVVVVDDDGDDLMVLMMNLQ